MVRAVVEVSKVVVLLSCEEVLLGFSAKLFNGGSFLEAKILRTLRI